MNNNKLFNIGEIAKAVGISVNSIMRNIDYMRGKYLRRVGPDKGGRWEVVNGEGK